MSSKADKKLNELANFINNQTQTVTKDLHFYKVRTSKELSHLKQQSLRLQNDCNKNSSYIAALLDILAEALGIQPKPLVDRFMFYIERHRVFDRNGNPVGKIIMSKYNFAAEDD